MTLKTDHRAHFSYLGGACLDPCHLWWSIQHKERRLLVCTWEHSVRGGFTLCVESITFSTVPSFNSALKLKGSSCLIHTDTASTGLSISRATTFALVHSRFPICAKHHALVLSRRFPLRSKQTSSKTFP
jgi:hypothetical protein